MPSKADKKPAPEPSRKRVFIVDDHPVFRDGLRRVIESDRGLTVCGEASAASQAFDAIRREKPDLVITDISLPGKSGLELLQDLHAFDPALPVLVISMHDESVYAERVLRAGGRGYVMKQEGPAGMLVAIQRVLSGKVAVSEKMAAEILDSISRPHQQEGEAATIGKLTSREFEVLRLIGQGKDSHDIADTLHLSIKTVDTHRGNIRQKLGLRNGTELIHYAVRWLGEEG
ncbi:MAG: response regulator transcription factor [Verrucomicrobiaceae bacterium]|nr:response regulator transcription factor [Verrucomicrobiaceae bacterium]